MDHPTITPKDIQRYIKRSVLYCLDLDNRSLQEHRRIHDSTEDVERQLAIAEKAKQVVDMLIGGIRIFVFLGGR